MRLEKEEGMKILVAYYSMYGHVFQMAQAVAEGFAVHVGIASDGRMGYCSLEQRETIVAVRREETLAAYGSLGIGQYGIHLLGFPDGAL